ncbi:hypothetical protein [Chlorogloea sp. CCALA 695]|nr:hypothetical protein [Chlorogloea sp. CCALA 695]
MKPQRCPFCRSSVSLIDSAQCDFTHDIAATGTISLPPTTL